jgi:hypothetical protein
MLEDMDLSNIQDENARQLIVRLMNLIEIGRRRRVRPFWLCCPSGTKGSLAQGSRP